MKFYFIFELCTMGALMLFCFVRTLIRAREISAAVIRVLVSVFIMIVGSLILASANGPKICGAGYMVYMCGTDLFLFCLEDFSLKYCGYLCKGTLRVKIVGGLLALDCISILTNPFFHHVFTLRAETIGINDTYYIIVSHSYRYVHLFLSALMLLMIVGIYIDKLRGVPGLYTLRYLVILISISVCIFWSCVMFHSGEFMNRSVTGYVICAALIYFFAVEYRAYFLKSALRKMVISNLEDVILFYDQEGKLIYVNKAAEGMFGITYNNISEARTLLGGVIRDSDLAQTVDFEKKRTVAHNGERMYYHIRFRRFIDSRGRYVGSFCAIRDYTNDEMENRRRRYIETHDALTDMINRESFIYMVDERRKQDPDTEFVMILSDIDEFKIINDIYGRDVADNILVRIAHNIRDNAHPESICCRWGGDRFAAFARREDISADGLEEIVRTKIGNCNVTGYPVVVHVGYFDASGSPNMPVTDMIDRCMIAISTVKSDYNKIVAVYSEQMRKERLWEQRITSELPSAIASGQIIPYLQPQYNNAGILTGAEALVRWQHPTEGFLSPAKFVPVFEKNGMIAQVDMYIWEEVCKLLSSWKNDSERNGLHLSVNISPKDFYFLDIYDVFTKLVTKYNIPTSSLHLEITETVVMNDARTNILTINRLRKYGFIVEMDDFGSGYSSLNLLRDMPVDVLKIDMVFLGKSSDPKKAEVILRCVISLAHELGLVSIAEGVERKTQLQMLTNMGCNVFQGYYFAKPMPVAEFIKLT